MKRHWRKVLAPAGPVVGGVMAWAALNDFTAVAALAQWISLAILFLLIPFFGLLILSLFWKSRWLISALGLYAMIVTAVLALLLLWGKLDVLVLLVAGPVPALIWLEIRRRRDDAPLFMPVRLFGVVIAGGVIGATVAGWWWASDTAPIVAKAEAVAGDRPYCVVVKQQREVFSLSDINRLALLGRVNRDGYDGFHAELFLSGQGEAYNWSNWTSRFEKLPPDGPYVRWHQLPCTLKPHYLKAL